MMQSSDSSENEVSDEEFEDSRDTKPNDADLDSMSLGDLLQTHKIFRKKLKPEPSSTALSSFPNKQTSKVEKLKKSAKYNFIKNAPREEPILSRPPRVVRTKNTRKVRKNDVIQRDPRFDDLSGTFSVEFFDEHYKFIQDKKEEELKDLKKMLKECEDPNEKEKIQRLVQKYKEERRVVDRRLARREVLSKHLDEQIEIVQAGQKPKYMKKEELRTAIQKQLEAKGLERETKNRIENREIKSTQKARRQFPARR